MIETRLRVEHEELQRDSAHFLYQRDRPILRLPSRPAGLPKSPLRGVQARSRCSRPFGDELSGPDLPYSRATNHARLPGGTTPRALRWCGGDIAKRQDRDARRFYPLRLAGDEQLLGDYVALARQKSGVTFLGRLSCYAYIDMDVAITRAMETAKTAINAFRASSAPPAFVHATL